jgi:type VI secretion system secreted protein Hcp
MPIFMKYEGLKGSATAEGYEKWIELVGASFVAARTHVTGKAVPKGSASHTELVIQKRLDKSSTALFEECLTGEGRKTVNIAFCHGTPQHPEAYLKVDLDHVLVSGYSVGGSRRDFAFETLRLDFTKITYTTISGGDSSQTSETHQVKWDLASQSAS